MLAISGVRLAAPLSLRKKWVRRVLRRLGFAVDGVLPPASTSIVTSCFDTAAVGKCFPTTFGRDDFLCFKSRLPRGRMTRTQPVVVVRINRPRRCRGTRREPMRRASSAMKSDPITAATRDADEARRGPTTGEADEVGSALAMSEPQASTTWRRLA